MALIKCSECGKEFSDKASACPNCACPVLDINTKKEHKQIKEKEIIRATFNYSFLDIIKIIFIALAVLVILMVISFSTNLYSDMLYLCFLTLPFAIIFILSMRAIHNVKKTVLVLTNKRIYGTTFGLLQTTEIDLPLEKISSIMKIKCMGCDALCIEVTGSTKHIVWYMANADKFKKETLKLLEKK